MAEKRIKVTMADIARQSGVSLSTVSLVLNHRPGLPEETRLKVLGMARDLGYEFRSPPPVFTRPVILKTIGMLVKRSQGDSAPPSSNIFFSHVISGIEAGCRQENISLLYSTLPVDGENNSLEIPRLIEDERVNGLMLVGSYVDERLNQALRQRGLPVILVDGYCNSNEYDSIIIDNVEGAYLAIQHLIEHGHRHIAFLGSYPQSRLSFHYRREGYQQALADHGITGAYYGDCPHNNREMVIATTRHLLSENPQITAIFGCNDEVAILAMHGALQAGRRVCDDVSIIGFDDNANAENTIPPLTTMHVDKLGMGRLAVQMIMDRAANPELGRVTTLMHTHLIERLSVRNLVPEL